LRFCPASRDAEKELSLPTDDPLIEEIRQRLCTFLERQAHHTVDDLAANLGVDADSLRLLIDVSDSAIDVAFLVDVVAAVVREFAVDPQWLLTGRYDSAAHRHALSLGENGNSKTRDAVRAFVREQYYRLRNGLSVFSWPLRIKS